MGVLIDVDHLFDYYRWYVLRKRSKIFLLFHAWEYSVVGLLLVGLVFYHPILLAAVLAHLGHIATDHFHNRTAPWGYFITYRALVGFDTSRILPNQDVRLSYKSWLGMVPFGKRIEPWFERKIEPWFQSRIIE